MTPEFIVEAPASRLEERDYALSVLFGDWLGAAYTIRPREGTDETRIHLGPAGGAAEIVLPDVLLSAASGWLAPASLPPAKLPTVALPEWSGPDGTLPLLYERAVGGDDLMRRDGERFRLRLDLIGSLVFLLTGYEESVAPGRRDRHGRFPAGASALGAAGWLQWPVLDMYLHVFAGLVRYAWPRIDLPVPPPGAVTVGHDVDHPSSPIRWHGLHRVRKVAGDVLRRRDLGLAARRTSAFLPRAGWLPRYDPYNTYAFLMEASEAVGLRSTFFFLARDTERPYGSRYRLSDPWVRPLMDQIARRGHHVGLHGSYDSSTDAERIREEWSILEQACTGLPAGTLRRTIRQHYLRQSAALTWRAQAEAGLAEDESLVFADAAGYRAGTARSFPAYDLERHRPLPLRIRPLHVMDGTLSRYLELGDEEARTMVVAMGRRTRTYGGSFSVLWHNSSLETGRARRFYRELLAELTA